MTGPGRVCARVFPEGEALPPREATPSPKLLPPPKLLPSPEATPSPPSLHANSGASPPPALSVAPNPPPSLHVILELRRGRLCP